MPKRKRKFIPDKKAAISFKLVHRSQKDPLIASEDASQLVLAPVTDTDPGKRREEQQKFGIHFDDDYNYLQHLRDVDEVYSWGEPVKERYRVMADGSTLNAGLDLPVSSTKDVTEKISELTLPTAAVEKEMASQISKLSLPSSLFESEGVELKTGLLNQAAPRPGPHPELDLEVLAALEDDFDFEDPENLLEDDFVINANQGTQQGEELEHLEELEEEDDCLGLLPEMGSESGSWDERRSRFTDYSISSSVIRRSKGLQTIDEMFEKHFEKYDEEELGSLEAEGESEALVGHLEPDSDFLLNLVEEFQQGKTKNKAEFASLMASKAEVGIPDEEEAPIWIPEHTNRPNWDCESIISRYSNLYNHPSLIEAPKKSKRIRLDPRTGMPANPRPPAPSVVSRRSDASTVRPKDETPEQRRLRKQQIRLQRQERRSEKKANKLAFGQEEKKLQKHRMNARNLVGVKLP